MQRLSRISAPGLWIGRLGLRLVRSSLPEASPLRKGLREGRRAAAELLDRVALTLMRAVRFDDVRDRGAWSRLLAASRCPPWRAAPGEGLAGAAGLVLDHLLSHPELDPSGLGDGPDGVLCRAILAAHDDTLDARARENLRAVFAAPPGERVLMAFDTQHEHRRAHPLALTPIGLTAFVRWLVLPWRRAPLGIEAHHLAWFALEVASDETAGVVATYLRTPAWQAAIPEGLGARWPALVAWVAAEHGLDGLPASPPARAVGTPGSEAPLGDRPWRSLAPDTPIEGVNVIGMMRHTIGLGQAARNLVEALEGAGLAVAQRDELALDCERPGRRLDLEPHPVSILVMTPEMTQSVYERVSLWRRPGVHRIGVWYWELAQGDEAWRRWGDFLDEVWCPTRFIAEAARGVMRVPVVPMLPGIDPPRFEPRPRAHFGLPADAFLFLFMFDMASHFERKNPLAIVRAFRRAFSPSDPVRVVIKVARAGWDRAGRDALYAEASAGGVIIIEETLARPDVYALMHTCDAYVSLHRAEGYGLTLAEAMALGKPVIATGYSGNVDFMDESNARLVGHRMVEITRDARPYKRGARWADPDVDEAARLMRWAFEDRQGARELGARAARSIREQASLEAAAARMRARLSAIGRAGARAPLVYTS